MHASALVLRILCCILLFLLLQELSVHPTDISSLVFVCLHGSREGGDSYVLYEVLLILAGRIDRRALVRLVDLLAACHGPCSDEESGEGGDGEL